MPKKAHGPSTVTNTKGTKWIQRGKKATKRPPKRNPMGQFGREGRVT